MSPPTTAHAVVVCVALQVAQIVRDRIWRQAQKVQYQVTQQVWEPVWAQAWDPVGPLVHDQVKRDVRRQL